MSTSSKRTYYLAEGEPLCPRHYDCGCCGFEAPVCTTRRPRWPQSNGYIHVRAYSTCEAIAVATQQGGRVCYSGGRPRRIGVECERLAMLADVTDHDCC